MSSNEKNNNSKPLLFISHKHDDKDVAEVIADFIKKKSGGRIRVYLSSNANYEGPRQGKSLNNQLKKALWEAAVVILVYTSNDNDWSFCMWECGVATDPRSVDTNIIVFQCMSDRPAPFDDQVRVKAWEEDDIERFAKEFLIEPSFFPGYGKAIAPGYSNTDVKEEAEEFSRKLKEKIPADGPARDWPALPFLQLELKRACVEQIVESKTQKEAIQIVRANSTVAEWGSGTPQLFGKMEFSPQQPFTDLLRIWEKEYPHLKSHWFDSLTQQIAIGAIQGIQEVQTTLFREIRGNSEYIPVLSRIWSIPNKGKILFSVYFYAISSAVLVTTQMTKLDKIYHGHLGNAENIKLKDLLHDLEIRNWRRVPIVDANNHPMYIIHSSMIDKFIRMRAFNGSKIEDLTLKDLLNEDKMLLTFQNTFVVVNAQATIKEARLKMESKVYDPSIREGQYERCQDVFVTKNGTTDEPVLGWLTDRDLIDDIVFLKLN